MCKFKQNLSQKLYFSYFLSVIPHFFIILHLLKKFGHIINTIVLALTGLYLFIVIMGNIPMVQLLVGSKLASAMATKFATEVHIGKVNIGFFNRIIIDDVSILDQNGKHLLRSSRMSAKINFLEIMRGNIIITSAQLFGLDANLYKENATEKNNFQFIIDSLQSKDKTGKKTFNLAINSLIIRHGKISWNQLDAIHKKTFDTKHIKLSNISSHIIINALNDDSLKVTVKRISFKEASGINLNSLSMNAEANKKKFAISDLRFALQHSQINIPHISGNFSSLDNFKANITESRIQLSDLSPVIPQMAGFEHKAILKSTLSGNHKRLKINEINISIPQEVNTTSPSLPCMNLSANCIFDFNKPSFSWKANISQFSINSEGLKLLAGKMHNTFSLLNSLNFSGFAGGDDKIINLVGNIISDAGNAMLNILKEGDEIEAKIQTASFNVGQILNNKALGRLSTNVSCKGNIKDKRAYAKGTIERIDYNRYTYNNIILDGELIAGNIKGKLNISDPNITAEIFGSANIKSNIKTTKINANIKNLAPSKLHLFNGRLAEATYAGNLIADVTGNDVNNASGYLTLKHFTMKSKDIDYTLDSIRIQAGASQLGHYIGMQSDFGKAIVHGHFNYANLPQVVKNVIVKKLPSITNLVPFEYKPINDAFSITANINKSDWIKVLLGFPLEIRDTLSISATMNDKGNSLNAAISSNDIVYSSHHLKNIKALIKTKDSYLHADISLSNVRNKSVETDLNLSALMGEDKLQATLSVDNNATKDRLQGGITSFISFHKDHNGNTLAELNVQKSNFCIGDTLFEIHPSTVTYSKNRLSINSFSITSGNQSLLLNGIVSQNNNDSLTATLHNINVAYILDLVNFHSVEFSGAASGTAHVSQLFSKPTANAQLQVNDFRLIDGRLGTLNTHVNWNEKRSQIDIDAVAIDTITGKKSGNRYTFVKGYVSPKRNYIDLGIKLQDTRAELLKSLCSSFLKDVDINGNGNLRLWGDLKKINLTGNVVANGSITVSPLGTKYKIPKALLNFTEKEIQFANDTVYDTNGNFGIVQGAIHHQNLGRMTYDINVEANNLLAFNFDGKDGSTFYGKVFGTGNASIKGRSGTVDIDVNMRPELNSEIVYDISSPDNIGSQDFIHWVARDSANISNDINNNQKTPLTPSANNYRISPTTTLPLEISTDIRLNFLIDAHPNATLKLITDHVSGDHITLNGSGALRATYFNKGGVDIWGTYAIDHGIYKLTIQNIIKKEFEFTQDGTIVFGGDPYNATLNLKAQYPIASVSLSDLQVGRSFSSNNVRVNCLMGITGTPASPQVDFNLDFPTLNQDQQQMISSVMNGEEEMNQQVLYLLAVGRFYSRGNNNAGSQSYNQTSLAMQSILSGELSQQINRVLGSVVKNNDWNFGANISTGDEGWNNAEYEGLLSGHLFNNRLLIDGQFGYRDNANATQSFIGDFDVRYLIVPNGNFSVHVYNKTNDRYFTRNSLNTQGIGFILKKDFSSLRDLFRWGKRKKE